MTITSVAKWIINRDFSTAQEAYDYKNSVRSAAQIAALDALITKHCVTPQTLRWDPSSKLFTITYAFASDAEELAFEIERKNLNLPKHPEFVWVN
jgi:hypothetical protein